MLQPTAMFQAGIVESNIGSDEDGEWLPDMVHVHLGAAVVYSRPRQPWISEEDDCRAAIDEFGSMLAGIVAAVRDA